jgi:hypothetical protein
MAIAEFVEGRALTVEHIRDIIERGRKVPGVIVNDLMRAGASEHWIINEAFRALGSARQGRQVGWDISHLDTVRWDYMIRHHATGTSDGHFVLCDRAQSEIFDPWKAEQIGQALPKGRVIRRLLYRTWEA